MKGRKRDWQEAMENSLPPLPEKKKFSPRFDLPELASYEGKFKAEYWSKWVVRKMRKTSTDKSWVSHVELRKLAEKSGMRDRFMMERVCSRLEKGAEVGVEGRGRLPTRGKNSPTVYEHGHAVADALQEGIVEGYLTGPYSEEELVALVGKDFTVSPINNNNNEQEGWVPK